MTKTLEIQSYRKPYSVHFVSDAVEALKAELKPEDVFILDQRVYGLYAEKLDPVLTEHRVIQIEAVEDNKSYDGVRPIIMELIENGFKKNHRLVAIGGGITQDVTAFMASILYRGVDWIFLPTNLLSQCDSCIGSKTSINFVNYKNQIGGFYPPQLILSDPSFLETLEDQEIRSGLGEMAHYFLIEGEEAFSRYEQHVEEALKRGPALLELIQESLAIKKRMIEIDEFDEGPRNVFNYGHSFGHAIEGFTHYGIPHGLAVSFGMDIANAQSVRLGLISDDLRQRVRGTLKKVWRKVDFPEIDLDSYINILRKDKKNVGNDVRVILTRGLGEMFIDRIAVDEDFVDTLKECFAAYQEKR